MLSPSDISNLCLRKYPAFLRAVVTGDNLFPLEIRFGRPSTTEDWSVLQHEITALANHDLGYRIGWTHVNTRRWGRQRLPERVWFDNEEDFLRTIRKEREVDILRRHLALTRQSCPELEGWLVKNVL